MEYIYVHTAVYIVMHDFVRNIYMGVAHYTMVLSFGAIHVKFCGKLSVSTYILFDVKVNYLYPI